jgi:hypothetical protein
MLPWRGAAAVSAVKVDCGASDAAVAAQNLATAKSVPDVIEYSRAHARVQFDALTAQNKELTELAHYVATQMAEPRALPTPARTRLRLV